MFSSGLCLFCELLDIEKVCFAPKSFAGELFVKRNKTDQPSILHQPQVSSAAAHIGQSRASVRREASALTSVVQVKGAPVLVCGNTAGLLSAMDLRKCSVPLFGQSATPQLLGKCTAGDSVTQIEPHPSRHGELFVQVRSGSIWVSVLRVLV
jgi:hypothetical protein